MGNPSTPALVNESWSTLLIAFPKIVQIAQLCYTSYKETTPEHTNMHPVFQIPRCVYRQPWEEMKRRVHEVESAIHEHYRWVGCETRHDWIMVYHISDTVPHIVPEINSKRDKRCIDREAILF